MLFNSLDLMSKMTELVVLTILECSDKDWPWPFGGSLAGLAQLSPAAGHHELQQPAA